MNIDFITYSPPQVNYDLLTLWGQVIYIPKISQKNKKPALFEFLNCFKISKEDENAFTFDQQMLNRYGIPTDQILNQTKNTIEPEQQYQFTQEIIPCLYLNSMVNSKYLFLYFHASGEDIKLAREFLNHMRNIYQSNILAIEYPGYSIYKGSPSSEQILQDALSVYDYLINVVRFRPENIIVVGRSIGTSTALDLAIKRQIGALALISPFSSLKSLTKQLAGSWASYLVKQKHNNIQKIQLLKYPLFIVHGKADKLVSYQQSIHLSNKYKGKIKTNYPKHMTHSQFDYYLDFTDPFRQFLFENSFNFYIQQFDGPKIPEQLYKNPLEVIKEQAK